MDGRAIRVWLTENGGAVLLAGGLLALGVPVTLADYDNWGTQIACGNGYHSELQQAQVSDEASARRPASATDSVGHCNSAIAHRRAWAAPITGAGALILLTQAVRWARSRERQPGTSAHAWSTEHPDEDMHDAQVLDRRERSHWEHPLEHEAVSPRRLGRHSGV